MTGGTVLDVAGDCARNYRNYGHFVGPCPGLPRGGQFFSRGEAVPDPLHAAVMQDGRGCGRGSHCLVQAAVDVVTSAIACTFNLRGGSAGSFPGGFTLH